MVVQIEIENMFQKVRRQEGKVGNLECLEFENLHLCISKENQAGGCVTLS